MDMNDFKRIAKYTNVGSIYGDKSLISFAEAVAYESSERQLTHCINLLDKYGMKEAADILRGEG
jgi:hypothetical protein